MESHKLVITQAEKIIDFFKGYNDFFFEKFNNINVIESIK